MTSKQKARELCKKAAKILGYFEYDLSEEVKDVALLCVDEMIKEHLEFVVESSQDRLAYLQEVKQEINK
jgi:hypothetical protein